MSTMLCPDCLKLNPYVLKRPHLFNIKEYSSGAYILKSSLEALQASAQFCRLCTLFLHDIARNYSLSELREIARKGGDTRVGLADGPPEGGTGSHGLGAGKLHVLCHFQNTSNIRKMPTVVIAANPGDLAARSGDIHGRLTFASSPSTGDGQSLEVARQWLQNCIHNHTICNELAGRASSFVPSRLIDVGPQDGSREPHLHVQGQEPAADHRYTALSHCWGSSGILQTMQATLRSHMVVISFASLPKTFQHAVNVTRVLGIRYIWIDSLCILQDSAEDWQQESSKMYGIYANAVVTIAASAAKDSSYGLYVSRPVTGDIETIEYECKADEGHGEALGDALMILARVAREPRTQAKRAIEDAPLNQRAWTLQERLLSPRVLHFTSDQIFYQCRESFQSEDFSFRGSSGLSAVYENMADCIVTISQRHEAHPEDWALSCWRQTVELYTQREITKHSDRLPALAGIVKAFNYGSNIETLYVAGHWLKNLYISLLWSSKDGRRHNSQAYAPSWSWAALEGPIQYDEPLSPHQHRKCAQFCPEVEIEGDYLTGSIRRADLKTDCLLKQAWYDADESVAGYKHMQSRWRYLRSFQKGSILGRCLLDEDRFMVNGVVHCALVCQVEPDLATNYPDLSGLDTVLILQQSSGCSDSNFSRIGLGYIDLGLRWFEFVATEDLASIDHNAGSHWHQLNKNRLWKHIVIN